MSLIALPAIVSNIRGGFYSNRNFSVMGYTMLGNQDGFYQGTQLTEGVTAHEDNDIDDYFTALWLSALLSQN